jgi:hypothetical protein
MTKKINSIVLGPPIVPFLRVKLRHDAFGRGGSCGRRRIGFRRVENGGPVATRRDTVCGQNSPPGTRSKGKVCRVQRHRPNARGVGTDEVEGRRCTRFLSGHGAPHSDLLWPVRAGSNGPAPDLPLPRLVGRVINPTTVAGPSGHQCVGLSLGESGGLASGGRHGEKVGPSLVLSDKTKLCPVGGPGDGVNLGAAQGRDLREPGSVGLRQPHFGRP